MPAISEVYVLTQNQEQNRTGKETVTQESRKLTYFDVTEVTVFGNNTNITTTKCSSETAASVHMFVVSTNPFMTLTLSFQATSHNHTILHQVTSVSSSASCTNQVTPNKAETTIHECWLLSSILHRFVSLAVAWFHPF